MFLRSFPTHLQKETAHCALPQELSFCRESSAKTFMTQKNRRQRMQGLWALSVAVPMAGSLQGLGRVVVLSELNLKEMCC